MLVLFDLTLKCLNEHCPRDPGPEIGKKEAAGDSVFHIHLVMFKMKRSLGLGLFHGAH